MHKHVATRVPVAAALIMGFFTTIAMAAPVTGTLNFAGTAIVTKAALDFIPPVNAGTGTIETLYGNTGTFAPLDAFYASPAGIGTILDRTEEEQPVGTTGAPYPIEHYLTLTALPNLVFTLDYIAPGSFPSHDCFAAPANQQTCTLPPSNTGALSPYNFSNYVDAIRGLSSSASFSLRGRVWDTATPTIVSNYNGVFTATFLGRPFQTNINAVLSGGSVTAPFSASFSASPVPEPSTALFIIGGGALLLLSRRIRRS